MFSSRLAVVAMPVFLIIACGGSTGDENNTGGNGNNGNNGNNTSSPPTVTADCDSVCDHLLTCMPEGDVSVCQENCAPLRASCRACLAKNTCTIINAGDCDAICGANGTPQPEDPPAGSSCVTVTFARGNIGDGTRQLHTGSQCRLPGECLSERCVTADISDYDSKSWCGNKGDCRAPNNDDEKCPSGWTCTEIAHFPFDSQRLHLCVPPEVTACDPEE